MKRTQKVYVLVTKRGALCAADDSFGSSVAAYRSQRDATGDAERFDDMFGVRAVCATLTFDDGRKAVRK